MQGDSRPSFSSNAAILDPPVAPSPRSESDPESIYRSAAADIRNVPWAIGRPDPALIAWLNTEATARVRPGSRAIVVGCGLGDDVAELINRGYDASGFDVSPAAVEWSRRRFPAHANAFLAADLFNLPTRFRHRFELVVEAFTLQSLDPAQRETAAQAIAHLCGPRGVLLTICTARDESAPLDAAQGPPFPLTRAELTTLFESAGLKPTRALDDFTDETTRCCRLLRCAFERA